MTAYEMWDFLGKTTADSKTLVALAPQHVLTEVGDKNVVIHMGDDGSEERIALDNTSIFRVKLRWDYLSPSDAGTIVNQYYSTGEGNGRARSWRWAHPTDGHDYTVRFDTPLSRAIMPRSGDSSGIHQIPEIILRILGRST
jgi:hypothetical protein